MQEDAFGSVYLALAGAGPCPVVLVPAGVERMPVGGPIVCGIDGSEAAQNARRVAADLAYRLDARLKLVHSTSVLGAAAERLTDVADRASAQLLVVGSRGHGQLASTLLGSVASELATTATRPLVIVPPQARSPRTRGAVILATRRLRNSTVLQVQGEIDVATAVELE